MGKVPLVKVLPRQGMTTVLTTVFGTLTLSRPCTVAVDERPPGRRWRTRFSTAWRRDSGITKLITLPAINTREPGRAEPGAPAIAPRVSDGWNEGRLSTIY